MSETFVLTTAEVKPAISTANYRLILLHLDWEQALIVIHLRGENGELREFRYGGPNADADGKTKAITLMVALNKANLSIKSLQRRVLEQLAADGLLLGAVSGTPD